MKYQLLTPSSDVLDYFVKKQKAKFQLLRNERIWFSLTFRNGKIYTENTNWGHKVFSINKKTDDKTLHLDFWSFLDGSISILIERINDDEFVGRVKIGSDQHLWYRVS